MIPIEPFGPFDNSFLYLPYRERRPFLDFFPARFSEKAGHTVRGCEDVFLTRAGLCTCLRRILQFPYHVYLYLLPLQNMIVCGLPTLPTKIRL